MKQLMLDILEDTVKYYSQDTNRRALDPIIKDPSGNQYCTYFNSESKNKCAIGRLLNEEDLKKIITNKEIKFDTLRALKYKMEFTTPIINELPIRFMAKLQQLHDAVEFWDEKGLTVQGLRYYEGIKELIERGELY